VVEINELIGRFERGFKTLDAELLTSIWADDDILYSPVELADPIRTVAELADYYRNISLLFSQVEDMDVFDTYQRTLADDCVVAYFRFRFHAVFLGAQSEHRVEGRASVVFRRRDGEWRGVHYHESLVPGQT
jgi:ketosteroid isomerase-like protein